MREEPSRLQRQKRRCLLMLETAGVVGISVRSSHLPAVLIETPPLIFVKPLPLIAMHFSARQL